MVGTWYLWMFESESGDEISWHARVKRGSAVNQVSQDGGESFDEC